MFIFNFILILKEFFYIRYCVEADVKISNCFYGKCVLLLLHNISPPAVHVWLLGTPQILVSFDGQFPGRSDIDSTRTCLASRSESRSLGIFLGHPFGIPAPSMFYHRHCYACCIFATQSR